MENSKIPLKYMDRREEGDTVMRQCQLAQLHLLHVFDKICRDNNLTYFLDGGTLLGAMRHDGFIPWDDDLDVGMRRSDYNKFLKIAPALLPEDVLLQTPENTPDRVLGISKLKDAYSFCAEQSRGVSMTQANGIFIDIMPYDDVPAIGNLWLQNKIVRICKNAYHYGRALKVSGGRGWFFSLFGGWLALPFYMVHYLIRSIFNVLLLILPCRRMFYGLTTLFVSKFPIKSMYPVAYHKFEDADFPVPHDSDAILTGMFGNWRKLPPESERQGGHGKLVLPFQAVMVPGSMEWKK